MCLYQTSNDRTDSSGIMCVSDMQFISVENIIGDFNSNGIIGLAPNNHERSYINQLFKQNKIKNLQIGLNFENPDDKQSKSMISFGYFDYSNVEGGKDGLNYYSNIGLNHWAVLMDDI